MVDKKVVLVLSVVMVVQIKDIYTVQTIKDVNTLTAQLLEGYNKNTLPSGNFEEKFLINVNVKLVALGDIDEIEERLSTVMMFIYQWNDASMQWDPSDHNNITNITMSWTDVWKPVLMIVNPHQDASRQHSEKISDTVGYSSTGDAYLLELVTFQTTCDLDTTFFPFDVQQCSIDMYFSENDAYLLRINATWLQRTSFSKENGAWNLISQDMNGDDFSRFKITIKMKRKPLFMLVNILLPIIVLALLTPMVFLMPKNSGERVGYSITMLLAISVYMTIISDHLPKNSDPMPLVSVMIFVWYVMNSSIVFIVIVNTKINHTKDGRPVPNLARKFVILTRKIKGQRRLHVGEASEAEIRKGLKTAKEEEDEEEEKEMNGNHRPPLERSDTFFRARYPDGVTWQELSVAIDKWGVVLSYVIKIAIPIIFFTIMKAQSY